MTEDTSKRVETHLETIRAELARMSTRTVGNSQSIARRDPRKRMIEDRYELLRQIGTGGMGVVFLAMDRKLERHVAIKRLVVKSYNARTVQRRFLREAQTIAQLAHYNIVNIFDVGQDEDGHYIIMEYVPGPEMNTKSKSVDPAMPLNLHGYLNSQGPMSLDKAIPFMRKVCLALDFAHRASIIHRDIKPTNILINPEFEPKLVDFGLARPLNLAKSEEITLDGSVLGTPEYCAPEQWNDASRVDVRADIYAVAGVYWFALSGRSPRYFRESDVDARLAPILAKALASRPDQRYESARELAEEIDGMAEPEPVAPALSTLDISASQGFWICRHCEASNPDSAKYCVHCGASGLENCPNCATQFRVGTQHCPGCGVDVKVVEECATLLSTARNHASFCEFETALDFLTETIRNTSPEARKLYKDWREKILNRRNLMMEMDGALRVFNIEKAIDLAVQLKTMVPEECLSESADFKAASSFAGMLEELKQMLIEGANRARQDFNLGRFSQNIQYLNKVYGDDVCHVINQDLQQVEMVLDDALTQAGLAAGMNCFGRAQEILVTTDAWKGAELGTRRARLSATCAELVDMREHAIEETERAVANERYSEALVLLKETSRFRLPPGNSEISPGRGDREAMDRIIKLDKALMATIEENISGWIKRNSWDNVVNALAALKGSESTAWKKLGEKLRTASNQEIVRRYNYAIELEKKERLRKADKAWQEFLLIPPMLSPSNLFQYAAEYSRRVQNYRRRQAERLFRRFLGVIVITWIAFLAQAWRQVLIPSEELRTAHDLTNIAAKLYQLSPGILALLLSVAGAFLVRLKWYTRFESRQGSIGVSPRLSLLALLLTLSPLAYVIHLVVSLSYQHGQLHPAVELGVIGLVWLGIGLFRHDGLPVPGRFGLLISWLPVSAALFFTPFEWTDACKWGAIALVQTVILGVLFFLASHRRKPQVQARAAEPLAESE